MNYGLGGRLAGRLVRRLGWREVRLTSSREVRPTSSREVRLASTKAGGQSYKQQRLEVLGQVEYPHKFPSTMEIPAFTKCYKDLGREEVVEDVVSLCGMVAGVREAGKRLRFLDLEGRGGRVQLKVDTRTCLQGEATAHLRRGDRVGVTGSPVRTKAGELSLSATSVSLLAPCLRQLPAQGFDTSHKRLHRKYLDFLVNDEAKNVIMTRSRIVRYFRDFFHSRGYLEVETPILSHSLGGAAARPFTCHHHHLDQQLYLRVAPELFLKQMVVGGFDRVFEIGKQFRNECVDYNHNPEFTSCEFYEAWSDYRDLMSTTEELLGGLVTSLELEPRHQGVELDFTSQYQRLDFLPSLEAALGCSLAPAMELEVEGSRRQLEGLCRREGLLHEGSVARLLDRLAGKLVEPELKQPSLLLHHPSLMSPLAKPHRELPGLAERFELFVGGQEVCNAYTELNDPSAQRSALASQACSTDPEAMLPDEEFCLALEYGLPPTAGWGCGMDRLTAILTNSAHIRDTITFPLVAK